MTVELRRYQGATLGEALLALFDEAVEAYNSGIFWSGVPTPSDAVVAVTPTGYLSKILIAGDERGNTNPAPLASFVAQIIDLIGSTGEGVGDRKAFINTLPIDRLYGMSGYGWTFEIETNT